MGTLEKSSKSHEISTSRSRFAKSDDFQLRNASDDVKETIREKMHRFSAIFRDPEHFSLKIVDFAASGTNRPFDVVGSVPELKIIVFCKA